ncbi:MAG: hypothetical protein DPW09_30920 [Anaerolineae bacterium]|nr:hypothetical protein [Anaerolineae bacterium]MCQ3977862.1 hypothetical protein [Anaerolineae bacterium]
MSSRGFLFLLVFLFLFLFALAQIQDQSFTQPEFISDEIIVKFQRYISTAGLLSSTRIMDGVRPLSILPRIQLIRLQVESGKERAIIEDLLPEAMSNMLSRTTLSTPLKPHLMIPGTALSGLYRR